MASRLSLFRPFMIFIPVVSVGEPLRLPPGCPRRKRHPQSARLARPRHFIATFPAVSLSLPRSGKFSTCTCPPLSPLWRQVFNVSVSPSLSPVAASFQLVRVSLVTGFRTLKTRGHNSLAVIILPSSRPPSSSRPKGRLGAAIIPASDRTVVSKTCRSHNVGLLGLSKTPPQAV